MALPIAPTPVLEGREAAEFLKRMTREENEKTSLSPTPNLEKAREKILANARSKKK
jgi:hypothetical protein